MDKTFTLYRANYSQRATNADYPHKEVITSLQDLLRTARKDHIFSEMKGSHRAKDNYLSTDGLVLDLDNTFSDDPNEWKTIDDIEEALPEVMFYYVESRNHMKTKKKTNSKGITTYEEARPKYHLYFPLSKKVTDHEEINRLMLEAAGLYCYMDLASAEPQHFFYGVPEANGGEIDGKITIDEYITNLGEDLRKVIENNLDEYEQSINAGLYNSNKETEKAISRLNGYIGRQPKTTEQKQETLTTADPVDWIDSAERDKKLKWFEDWAEKNNVNLGKRYKVNTQAHPNAVVICVTCPWEDEHSMNGAENETVVIIDTEGYHFLCRHSHGSGLSWKDYRKKVEESNAQNIQAPEATNETIPDAEDQKEKYKQTSAVNALQDFIGKIKESADTPALSTGFDNLDSALDGGLYEGLYILGAISSLGKTTLALQIIDQLAQQGQDCLIFSLEMARHELIAKSISRHTFLLAERKADAKTTRGITAGARYARYSNTEKALINKAIGSYKEYAQHVFIHEGIGDIGVEQIKEVVKKHISITGNKPVVLIDYMQILAPYDVRASDKQNTDKATLELKRLSRDYKIPVIGISSFNRDNYTAPVNNASFKESGAIEYGSDVLIGLQYYGMDYQEGEAESARQKRIRTLIQANEDKARRGEEQVIQAKILKSRNGSKGQALFNFYAMFNCFKEYEQDYQTDSEIAADIFSDMRIK